MILRPLAVATFMMVALAGCVPADLLPDTSPTSAAQPEAEPTPIAAPALPELPASSIPIPTDCRALVSPRVYEATFGDTPLNDPTVVGPNDSGAIRPLPAPADATPAVILSSATQLRCIWRDPRADITYLEATVAAVDPAVANGYLDELSVEGFTCQEMHGGRRCQIIKPNEMYPVDEAFTAFLRGDIYIFVGQANFRTDDLLGEFVANLWNSRPGF